MAQIETKFDPGDKVWFLSGYGVPMGYAVLGPYELRWVRTMTDTEGTTVIYGMPLAFNPHSVNEDRLFATEAEAQAECDRRNAGDGEGDD